MLKKYFIILLSFAVYRSSSVSIINSFINDKTGNGIDDACSLPPDLIAEIASYQPVVNKIVSAAVGGPFSGKTWNR